MRNLTGDDCPWVGWFGSVFDLENPLSLFSKPFKSFPPAKALIGNGTPD